MAHEISNPSQTAGADDIASWNPNEWLGAVHLFASSGRVQLTPNSRYNTPDTSVVDVIAVFTSPTDVTVYRDQWVGQRWFRVRLDPDPNTNSPGGGLLGGVLSQQTTSSNNLMWYLEDLTDAHRQVIQAWCDTNLTGDSANGYHLAGYEPAAAPDEPQTPPAAQQAQAPATPPTQPAAAPQPAAQPGAAPPQQPGWPKATPAKQDTPPERYTSSTPPAQPAAGQASGGGGWGSTAAQAYDQSDEPF